MRIADVVAPRLWVPVLAVGAVILAGVAQTARAEETRVLMPFTLPDQSGTAVKIDTGERYTLITFYRGDW